MDRWFNEVWEVGTTKRKVLFHIL